MQNSTQNQQKKVRTQQRADRPPSKTDAKTMARIKNQRKLDTWAKLKKAKNKIDAKNHPTQTLHQGKGKNELYARAGHWVTQSEAIILLSSKPISIEDGYSSMLSLFSPLPSRKACSGFPHCNMACFWGVQKDNQLLVNILGRSTRRLLLALDLSTANAY